MACNCIKTRLPDAASTREYMESQKPVYLVCCWAQWLIIDYPFSGYYKEINGCPVPLVWQHDDCNGTDDAYFLRPITSTTSGMKYNWTFDKAQAEAWLEEKKKSY